MLKKRRKFSYTRGILIDLELANPLVAYKSQKGAGDRVYKGDDASSLFHKGVH
jgi:hypothetical protein